MGWDDWSSKSQFKDKSDVEMDLKDKDIGLKEFEMEKVVTFVVRYKVLGKDYPEPFYLGCTGIDLGDLTMEKDKVYDFSVRNCGESEEIKPRETGNKVEKEYSADKEDEDFDEKEYDLKIKDELF